ncbi:hypothetical protein PENTCL1PPCAC_11194, partial [Pristionchus entomophagus]
RVVAMDWDQIDPSSPPRMGEVAVGNRVVVAELTPLHFERMHIYCNMQWTPDKIYTVGRIGLVVVVDEVTESAIVRFYASEMAERPYLKLWDATHDHTFPLKSLKRLDEVFFQVNDKTFLVSLNAPRKELSLEATFVVKSVDYSNGNYGLQACLRQTRLNYSRVDSPNEILLPIYLGVTLTHLQVESETANVPNQRPNQRSRGRGNNYRNNQNHHNMSGASMDDPRRLLYEPKGENPNRVEGGELIEAIKRWSDTGCKMDFLTLISQKTDLVNRPIGGLLPIQEAVIQGNLDAMVMLICQGADRSALDPSKNTLLHLAAIHGRSKVVEALLNFIPGEINSINLDGETPLHVAARHSKNSAVVFDRLLSAQSIKLNITTLEGDTVMHTVVKLPESETKQAMVSRLLMYSRGHVNLNQMNMNGFNPLHLACLLGMTKTVEVILGNRPQLNQVMCKSGLLPIHLSAYYGKSKTIAVFIENHPEMVHSLVPSTGQSCLHLSVNQWESVVDKDLDRIATIQALVSGGLNVNSRDRRGETALHILLKEMVRHREVYETLDLQSIVTSLGKDLKMSELATKVRPHWELAALFMLASNGADPRILNEEGFRALDIIPDLVTMVFSAHLARGAYGRPRSLLPMTSSSAEKFDMKEVTMCTFDCNDSPADVEFLPCGHRVICMSCVKGTSLRRCPLCYKAINSAKCTTDGSSVEICKKAVEERRQAEMEEQKRREEEAARKAEEKKEAEVRALKARLEELEHSIEQCVICMDAVPSIAFLCGHRACGDCSKSLIICHSCRKPITERITLF